MGSILGQHRCHMQPTMSCNNSRFMDILCQADAAACLRGRYSIDHCLYVAVAYCGSYSAGRAERARDAMTAMGISLNAGCFGKLNVGIPLFSCVMPIFRWGPRRMRAAKQMRVLLLHTGIHQAVQPQTMLSNSTELIHIT